MGLPAFSFGRPRRCLFSGRVHGHLWSHWRWGTSWICDTLWPSHRVNSSLAPACIASDQTREHIVHPLGERQESGGNGQWVMTCCGFQGTIRDQIQNLRIDQVEWHGPIRWTWSWSFMASMATSTLIVWCQDLKCEQSWAAHSCCGQCAGKLHKDVKQKIWRKLCNVLMIFDVSIPKGHIPFKLCHISRWDVEECEEHDWLLGWRGLIPSSSDWIAGTVEPWNLQLGKYLLALDGIKLRFH